jgi:hypothetical protein
MYKKLAYPTNGKTQRFFGKYLNFYVKKCKQLGNKYILAKQAITSNRQRKQDTQKLVLCPYCLQQ